MFMWKKSDAAGNGQAVLDTIEKLLTWMFAVRILFNVIKSLNLEQRLGAWVMTKSRRAFKRADRAAHRGTHEDEIGRRDVRRLEVFYEYMRMLVQFGLVMLASSCFYPGALLALFEARRAPRPRARSRG